jgi:adenylate cyclase
VRVSFKVTILALFATLTIGLTSVVVYVNYRRDTESTILAANRLFEQVTSRVFDAATQIFDPLVALADTVARLPGIDAVPAPGKTDTLIATILIHTLDRYPQVTSGYLADGAGQFYRIVDLGAGHQAARSALGAPGNSAYAVQSIVTGPDGRRVERWTFLDVGKAVLGTRVDANPAYDPRTRPWYRNALAADRAIVTDYYVFASVPSIGLTVARQCGDAGGHVFAIDVTLQSMSKSLSDVRASQLGGLRGAEIALFHRDGRILAYSDDLAYERTLEADQRRVPRVGEVGGTVLARVLEEFAHEGATRLRVADANGGEWLAQVARLPRTFGENAFVTVVVPLDELLGPLARTARQTLIESILVVLAMLPVVYLAARAVSAPLARVTREIEKIRDLDLAPNEPVASAIAEIQDLARALANARIMLGAFAKYVPKNLVRQIVASEVEPKLGGERRPLSVFFSDVKDFTTLSEELAPERLMELTSEYLEGLVKIILANQGTVDKFVGDQIMAYWNAPTPNPGHARDAARAVLRCRDWSNAYNAALAREGHPILYTRFALHLGDAIVGNVGSSDRMDYTVVGATINLGSRIEGLNKIYGTQVLITQPVVDALDASFVHRPVDRVLPKGAVHPLDVHELVGAQDVPELAVDARLVERCAGWRAFYEVSSRRDWPAAAAALATFRARHGEDSLTAIYEERLRRFLSEPPPADWDGVIRYTVK